MVQGRGVRVVGLEIYKGLGFRGFRGLGDLGV